MNIKNKKAFTLVEAVITALISSVVFAGIYSTYAVGNQAWIHYSDAVAVKKEARRALLRIVNELRAAENVRVIQDKKTSAIHFYLPSKGPISYIWDNRDGDTSRIIRRDRFNKRIVAQHISDLSFENMKDAVNIQITASKQISNGEMTSVILAQRVALRSQTANFRQ